MGFTTHGVKLFAKTVITYYIIYYYWIFFFLVERIGDGPVDVCHAFEIGVIQRYDIINNDVRTAPTRNRPTIGHSHRSVLIILT